MKVKFQCLGCNQVTEYFPNQKWCPECHRKLLRVGQCFVCLQERASIGYVVCAHCEPILIGLRKLLVTRSESEDGGYAAVDPVDMGLLIEVVYAVIAAKWDEDVDGDLPVTLRLVDLTRYHILSSLPVPYLHKARDPKEFLYIMRIAAGNASQAMKEYQDIQRDVYERFLDQLSKLAYDQSGDDENDTE